MSDGLSRAARLYARLCRIYPSAFRARFGDGMLHAFACDLDSAQQRGWSATLAFWIVTLVDLARFGIAEHLQRRTALTTDQDPGASMRTVLTTELRDAWRSLRVTPVVTAVAVLSLALGIGANSALFSILNSLVLKTLPVREPAQLALIEGSDWTNPIWEQVRDHQHDVADGAFAWGAARFDLAERGESDFVDGAWVSGGIFDVLGVAPARGRLLSPADDVRGGGTEGPVAVISYGLWQRRFGAAEDIVGRRITIEAVPFTIVGVAPPGFFGPNVGRSMDVAVPIGAEPLVRGAGSALDGRTNWWLSIMFRLRPGETIEQATVRLRGVQPQIREATIPRDWPAAEQQKYLSEAFTLVSASTGQSGLRDRYTRPLAVLLGVVGLVLLIACANIASLLLARAVARRHEFSVRLALGASRLRLARQLLAESLILAGAGAALGLVFAQWAGRALVAQLTALSRQVSLDLSLDWRVLAFTTAATCATVLIFGLAPAFGVSAIAPQEALKEQGRGVTGDRRMTLRHALVVMQIALSLTLVVGALLFARTFTSLVNREAGFDRDQVLVVSANVHRSAVPPAQRLTQFEQFRQAVAAVPGVAVASASFTTPTASAGWNMGVQPPPGSTLSPRQRMTWVNAVSPGWFSTYGMPLVAGRDVSTADVSGAPQVAVVNRAFAKRFLKEGNPVGQEFRSGGPFGPKQPFQVIGLVEDAIYRSIRAEMMPVIFVPLNQMDRPGPDIVLSVRSAGAPPASLARSITSALVTVEPRIALSIHTMHEQVDAGLTQERLLAWMSVFFGGLALLLAGVGLYGVTSYAVNSRRTEIGIRMALGANPGGVVLFVLRRVVVLVAIGIASGTLLSLWAGQFVATLLYGLEPRDPVTIAIAGLLLGVAGTFAGWIPARRASRADPTIVLRKG